MSSTPKKTMGPGWTLLIVVMGLGDLFLLISKLAHGHNIALFNSKGFIAKEQHGIAVYTVLVMLVLAVPSLLLLYFFAWKYRESNTKATYSPNQKGGKMFNILAWGVPTTFMVILATAMWPATHRLDPRMAIASSNKPLVIQVISLRWKWLFIYPEQGIATVNFIQVPIDTPLQFQLTADEAPMSSFWIPNLGGQLYSMTGHSNRLNLIADTLGDFPGSSAELNGAGFTGMKFTTRASTGADFDQWVQQVKSSPSILDAATYAEVLKPSENNPAAYYSSYESGLYDKVVMKYMGPSGVHEHSK